LARSKWSILLRTVRLPLQKAWKQYKELTTTQWVSAGMTEVGKLEEVSDNSPAVYSGSTIHDPDSSNDLWVGHNSIPLHSIFPLIEGKLMVMRPGLWMSNSGDE
jgi:hypothetical protein